MGFGLNFIFNISTSGSVSGVHPCLNVWVAEFGQGETLLLSSLGRMDTHRGSIWSWKQDCIFSVEHAYLCIINTISGASVLETSTPSVISPLIFRIGLLKLFKIQIKIK